MQWDERYSEPGYAYGTDANDFLVEKAGSLPSGKVLSVAEGEGRNAVFLAKSGYDVTAVDASSVGMLKAEQLAHDQQVDIKTIVEDLNRYQPGVEQWDAIVSIFCHLPEKQRAVLHQKLVKSLKRGGMLLLEAYTPKQLEFGTGGPGSVELLMTLDSLKREFEGLEFEVAQEIEREVNEGQYHHGHAAVVQVLARKL